MNTLSRRTLLKLAGMSAVAGVAAACAPPAPSESTVGESAASPAQATKTISCWLGGGYHPTAWTSRSAEQPFVVNAPRILAERFRELQPNTVIHFIDYNVDGESDAYAAWLTARISAGDAPDFLWSAHNIPVQNGWALPIEEYLRQPNPYATSYASWRDIFWPTLMDSLVWEDGHEYCAPVRAIWPYLEVGLAYHKAMFEEMGLKPPVTWGEQMEVCRELKTRGSGLSPWPVEGESGNLWPFALQILPPMLQELCKEMDKNGDMFVGADEALPAYQAGLIGMDTPIYKRAWKEMYDLAKTWVDGFNTTDLDLLWRQGELPIQYRATWDWSNLANDPTIEFEQGFLPAPMPTSADIPATADTPGAFDPPRTTPGDGSVPGDEIRAIQGPDWVMLKSSVEAHGNLDETIAWWQFLTTPENNAFVVNENQRFIPSAKDAPIGPLWQEVASIKLPIYEYTIAWWGMGLFWDAAHFQSWRRIFVAWVTDQLTEEEFYARQVLDSNEASARYAATLQGS